MVCSKMMFPFESNMRETKLKLIARYLFNAIAEWYYWVHIVSYCLVIYRNKHMRAVVYLFDCSCAITLHMFAMRNRKKINCSFRDLRNCLKMKQIVNLKSMLMKWCCLMCFQPFIIYLNFRHECEKCCPFNWLLVDERCWDLNLWTFIFVSYRTHSFS